MWQLRWHTITLFIYSFWKDLLTWEVRHGVAFIPGKISFLPCYIVYRKSTVAILCNFFNFVGQVYQLNFSERVYVLQIGGTCHHQYRKCRKWGRESFENCFWSIYQIEELFNPVEVSAITMTTWIGGVRNLLVQHLLVPRCKQRTTTLHDTDTDTFIMFFLTYQNRRRYQQKVYSICHLNRSHY